MADIAVSSATPSNVVYHGPDGPVTFGQEAVSARRENPLIDPDDRLFLQRFIDRKTSKRALLNREAAMLTTIFDQAGSSGTAEILFSRFFAFIYAAETAGVKREEMSAVLFERSKAFLERTDKKLSNLLGPAGSNDFSDEQTDMLFKKIASLMLALDNCNNEPEKLGETRSLMALEIGAMYRGIEDWQYFAVAFSKKHKGFKGKECVILGQIWASFFTPETGDNKEANKALAGYLKDRMFGLIAKHKDPTRLLESDEYLKLIDFAILTMKKYFLATELHGMYQDPNYYKGIMGGIFYKMKDEDIGNFTEHFLAVRSKDTARAEELKKKIQKTYSSKREKDSPEALQYKILADIAESNWDQRDSLSNRQK